MLNRESLQEALEGYVKVQFFVKCYLFTCELALPTQNFCFNDVKEKLNIHQQVETNLSVVL